ncbi:unnamed protein product [Schistocephalus solidus]|uniref:Ephrin_rec_like domain-containing protein n=1 Tax=Schistocephalus solidus TaxID=70667 RepID=A0A183T8M0_SCHSO|nr:unnamed protein product [Schistocephalus solidus]
MTVELSVTFHAYKCSILSKWSLILESKLDIFDIYNICCFSFQTHLESFTISSTVCTPIGGVAPLPGGPEETCLPCPKGTTVANSTSCKFCPKGQFSDDSGACSRCPAGEAPIFGVKYDSWHRMPPLVSTFCPDAGELVAIGPDDECVLWQQNGSSIFTGPGLEDYASSSLQLDLSDGFLTSNAENLYSMLAYLRPLPNTVLEVDFELSCTEECSLSLKKVRSASIYMLPEY